MFVGEFSSFTACYFELVKKVMNDYNHESAPRGQKIRECLGVSFTITNPRDRMLFVRGRKFSPVYLAAELLWYLSGNNETKWISKYSSFWNTISDDGLTANSAYGARLFQTHPKIAQGRYTQWEYVVNELRKDPDSRRAVMHLRVPDDSVDARLDVPCTLALQFFIRDGELHQIVHMRSSDVILGIAYDVPAFTMFQEIMANELGVEVGTYTHVSNSLHIYEQHFEMAEEIMDFENVQQSKSWSACAGEYREDTMLSLGDLHQKIIDPMFHAEAALWGAHTPVAILSVVDSFCSTFVEGTIWEEMFKLLAVKRLRSAGYPKDARDLMKTLRYRGYGFFMRKR